MATPMVMNLKNLIETSSDSDLVDPMMYRNLVGTLMYLLNTRLDIFFAMISLNQFMVESR